MKIYMIMFMFVSLEALLAIPFYFFGREWRREVSWVVSSPNRLGALDSSYCPVQFI